MAYFDHVASDYHNLMAENLKFSGLSPDYFDVMKVRLLNDVVSSYLTTTSSFSLLDFGCGIGKSHPLILKQFPSIQLLGADVSIESLEIAKKTSPSVTYIPIADDGTIPIVTPVDMVMISNVFHHIPFENHDAVLRSIKAILKPGGKVFLVEHNPLNPLTQYVVKTCPFDEDAKLLFCGYTKRLFQRVGFKQLHSGYIAFFPGFLSFAQRFEAFLRWCPLGAQYFYFGELL